MRRRIGRLIKAASREDGYTLTEMLVVLAIIGLIAAVLTPSLMGQLGRARAKAAQMQLDTLAASVEMFHADVGRYPTKAEGLNALVTEPSGVDGWTGPYLKDTKLLKDPWGGAIAYEGGDQGQTFAVKSLGRDQKTGGTGLDKDLVSPTQP